MALPQAVQRQVDAAEALEKSLAQAANEAQPAADIQSLPPQAPPAESASQSSAPPAPTPAPTEDWQQKYRSLQGLFAQKTSELQTQVKTYESQLATLQKQVSELAAQKEQKQERSPADPKDVENFGADMIEMVQRYAEQVFRSMADQFGKQATELNTRLASLEEQLRGVSTKTDNTLEQQFYATLASLVPDWEKINTDQRWLQWLAEVDPVYGVPRQVALDSAHQKMDVQRVAGVFNAFKSAVPSRKQESLANQVAPSGAASPAPIPQAAQKPIISAKSVEKFYRDLAQGKIKDAAEAARLEAEIDQAAAEGRIR